MHQVRSGALPPFAPAVVPLGRAHVAVAGQIGDGGDVSGLIEQIAAAVRTLIVATEPQAVADPTLIQDVDECALPLLPPRGRRAALRHM